MAKNKKSFTPVKFLKKLQDNKTETSDREKVLIEALNAAQAGFNCSTFYEAGEEIFKAAKRAVGAQYGYIALLHDNQDEEIKVNQCCGDFGIASDIGRQSSVDALIAECCRIKKTVMENNFKARDKSISMPDVQVKLENIILSPLIFETEGIGVIGLANKKGGFNDVDKVILNTFSNYATTTLRIIRDRNLLVESEKKYRDLFEKIPIGIYVTDSAEKIVDMNQKMKQMIGIDEQRDFFTSDIMKHYTDPQDRADWQNKLEKSGEVQFHETLFKCHDGTEIWVSENASLMKNPEGRQFCEVTIEDITTRKKAEAAFSETYLKLNSAHTELNERAKWMGILNRFMIDIAKRIDGQSILNIVLNYLVENFTTAFTGLMLSSSDGTSISIEPFINSNEKNEEQLPSKKMSVFAMNPTDRDLIRTATPGIQTLSAEYLLNIPAKSELHKFLQNLVSPGPGAIIIIPVDTIRENNTAILMALEKNEINSNEKYFLDTMTEFVSMNFENLKLYEKLKESYENLERAQESMKKHERIKAMGQIASGITHDINNTLAPVTLYTEALIETEEGLSERGRRFLKTIQNAVSDIENVTQRLRAFYKHDDDRIPESIFIKDLFNEVIELTRPRWESVPNKKGSIIKIKMDLEDPLSRIVGHRSDIREALVNCIFNAVDAIQKDGTITLGEKILSGYIKITVADTGLGMTEEQVSSCQNPFYTTKGSEGTGLGLSEVLAMIQRHEGNLDVISELGKGTVIELSFPAIEHSDTAELQNGCENTSGCLRILCVDDDSRILESLSEMLTLDGHDVETAESGAEGLLILNKYLKEKPFDAVISDLGMPGMDGFAFARRARELLPELPVIILSGWGNQLGKAEDISSDIYYVLSKPPRMNILRNTLNTIKKKDLHV